MLLGDGESWPPGYEKCGKHCMREKYLPNSNKKLGLDDVVLFCLYLRNKA